MFLHLGIIVAVVIAFYYRTYNYGYIIDDMNMAKPEKDFTKGRLKRFWEHYRGTKYTDGHLAHNITTAQHLVNCLLIYFAFGHNQISLFAALLFALNPVNNQTAIWISGKVYGTTAMLCLLGYMLPILMPPIFGVALLCGATAFSFPIVYLMKSPHLYFLVLPLIGYFFLGKVRNTVKARTAGASDYMREVSPKKIIILFKSLGYYTRLCILPYKVAMCHKYLHTFGLSKKETDPWYKLDGYFWLGVIVFGGGVGCLLNPTNPACFGFAWFVFMTLQWCNFVVINHPITERYVYLANIGLMWCLACLTAYTPLGWLLLGAYAMKLFLYMPSYYDSITYWDSNARDFPDVAMAWNQIGLSLVQYGNTGSGVDAWIKGMQVRPHDFRISFNLANILGGQGQLALSRKFLKVARENLDPRNDAEFWGKKIDEIEKHLDEDEKKLPKPVLIPPEDKDVANI